MRAHHRFAPAYGKFELSPEAVEGIATLVSAGASIASSAIQTAGARKTAQQQSEAAAKLAAIEVRKKEIEAKIAEAAARAEEAKAPTTKKKSKTKAAPGVPTVVWVGGGLTIVALAGFVGYRVLTKKKGEQEGEQK